MTPEKQDSPASPEPRKNRLGKRLRLTRRRDINRVFEQGRRQGDALVTLFGAPNGLDYSRAGVGVSAKHGSAARRNRVKRLCREAYRLTRDELPAGWDYMIVPRARRRLTVDALRDSLRRLAPQLADQPGRGGEPPS